MVAAMACGGCATALISGALNTLTHEPIERTKLPSKTFTVDATPEKTFQAALSVLQVEGYEIQTQDVTGGLIETVMKPTTSKSQRFLSGAVYGAKGNSEGWIVEIAKVDQGTAITLRALVVAEFALGKPSYDAGLSRTLLRQKGDDLARSIINLLRSQ
ncbi:MAG: hypothetical protein HY597_07350 [Candidatus Omnitrophica bacterium]|nr:hypothetical protein [Candidatus Omnitrophota bacterium]